MYNSHIEETAAETTEPSEIESRFEERYATDPWYIHLYRKSYAYHGVHPFYMWYWGAYARDYLGDVIIVGGDPKTTARMGYRAATSFPMQLGPAVTMAAMPNSSWSMSTTRPIFRTGMASRSKVLSPEGTV